VSLPTFPASTEGRTDICMIPRSGEPYRMSPPPLVLEHRCRVSVLEREILWRLEGDTLQQISEGLPPFAIRLDAIEGIRLLYAPTRFQAGRYACRLELRGGHSLGLQNEHFEGFATFADRSETYRPLVLALIHRRAALGPGCRYLGGTSMVNWILQTAILAGSGLLLAAVFLAFGPSSNAMILVKLIIIAAMLPIAIRWVAKNRPRAFDPGKVPEELLPPDKTTKVTAA